jgi:alpha-L-fucosidase
MKKILIFFVCFAGVPLFSLVNCHIETAAGPTPYSVHKNTSTINPFVDSLQKATSLPDSLRKAASLLDSLQKAYVAMKFGMFLHFNMSTFDRYDYYSVQGEWGLANSGDRVKKFRPSALNCGQWADAAKSAGCTYIVLTSKHHDGFCLWPSRYTDYCVSNAKVTRDVIKEFTDSTRLRGLKVGLYYSIRDLTNGYSLDFIKGQLSELLTNYGEITCLWFDGWGWGPGYNKVPYDSIKNIIQRLQPKCLIVENNHKFAMSNTEIVEYEMPIDGAPPNNNVLPAEGGQVIRSSKDHCWFWHPIDECTIMSARNILDELNTNISRNASYLLDLTPDTTGVIPQCQVDRMKEVGQLRGVTN